MDSSSTSFFEFIAIGLLLVYLFGKLLGFRRRVRGKSGKRAFSSHKASKGNAQRLAPTERQIALVDAMRKEGLLSDLEKRMIPANQSRSFYSYLIDRHIEEHDKLAAEHEEAPKHQEASATVDSSGDQRKWLDLDHLPPVDELPIDQRTGLFSKREHAFYEVLHRACGKQGLTPWPNHGNQPTANTLPRHAPPKRLAPAPTAAPYTHGFPIDTRAGHRAIQHLR